MKVDLSNSTDNDDSEIEIKTNESDEHHNKENKSQEENTNKIKKLKKQILEEKDKLALCEDKLKRSLADFQNLSNKTELDIENGVNTKIDKFMLNFLQIYDDFIRAKNSLSDEKINVEGLEAILRNMDSLLSSYGVTPIDAVGEILDPNLHESLSVIQDDTLDENTITKEIRKGYISHKRVIRPTLVETSKKSKTESLEGENNG